jgi:hypothetical protein
MFPVHFTIFNKYGGWFTRCRIFGTDNSKSRPILCRIFASLCHTFAISHINVFVFRIRFCSNCCVVVFVDWFTWIGDRTQSVFFLECGQIFRDTFQSLWESFYLFDRVFIISVHLTKLLYFILSVSLNSNINGV